MSPNIGGTTPDGWTPLREQPVPSTDRYARLLSAGVPPDRGSTALRVEVEASASAEELEALRAVLIEFGIDAGVEPTRGYKAAVEVVTLVVVVGGLALTTLSAAAKAFGKEIGEAAGEVFAPLVKHFCERLIGARSRPERATPAVVVEAEEIHQSLVIEAGLPLEAFQQLAEGDVPDAPHSGMVRYDRTERRWRAAWDNPDIPDEYREG